MADVGPLLRLYGVADSVFVDPPDGGVPPELQSWQRRNADPDAVGWYERAIEALELEHTPPITPDNRAEIAGKALEEIGELSAEDPLQPNLVLHAVTAVAHALPGSLESDGALREQGLAAAETALRSLSDEGERATAEAVLDAFITQQRTADLAPSAHWADAVERAGLSDQLELKEPPCNDELTQARTRQGAPTLAAKLTTEYDLDDVTLEEACSNFLAPGRWPECAKALWNQMSPCGDQGWVTDDKDIQRQSFREVVQIDGVEIVTCLTFAKVVKGDTCQLAYDLCDADTVASCAGGKIGDKVTVDHGYILVTKQGEAGAGVHVETVKTLRFRPPLDGVGAAMLACAIGYGPAGHAMAESCSQGDDK